MFAVTLLPFALAQGDLRTMPLGELDLRAMSAGYAAPKRDRTIEDRPLTIAGKVYPTGVGTHARSEMTVRLFGAATNFHAEAGLDDETGGKGSVVFMVYVDGKLRAKTPVMRKGDPARTLDVPLSGARRLTLVVDDAGDGIDSDHADWADALVTYRPGRPPVAFVPPVEPPMPIAPVNTSRTEINGPRVVGGTPGNDFLFRIPATGRPPLRYRVSPGLPEGLSIDERRGVISGRLARAGRTRLRLVVSGPGGEDSRDLTIVAGKDKLALTPPMGWNSWNVWAGAVDGQKIRDAADSLVRTGLADFGYQYVNIDDTWEAGRAADGTIQSNAKFGDMAALAQYVHNQGLKIGIYSSPGPKTCAGYEGSYRHEVQDAKTYADWGIDYLKYDWCSYGQIAPKPDRLELQAPYLLMREALDQAPRDIVYSLCQYGMGEVWNWGRRTGGDLWRTTGDITDTWDSMSRIGFSQSDIAFASGPGGWNDPDMLVVGKLGWGAPPRPTRLTPNEQITHITLWSMIAAPLIIGCDLTQLDDFTRRLLMNHDVIDVNQDELGIGGKRIRREGETEVWSKRLWDGSVAVALFNRGPSAAEVGVRWSDLDLRGAQPVRDLWRRRELGALRDGFRAKVAGHGAVLVRVGARARE